MVEWQRQGRSKDIEDRRGAPRSRRTRSARPTGRSGGRGKAVGGGGLLIALLVGAFQLFLGGGSGFDLNSALSALPVDSAPAQTQPLDPNLDPDRDLVEFISFVLDDVQDMWQQSFSDSGQTYQRATLVLYDDGTPTEGCGFGSAAAGPFYCPADQKVYLDLDFFKQLGRDYDAHGDFAQAYIIAHEIAHHVQNQLGISAEVRQMQSGADQATANDLSVRTELQADCLSGIWAFSTYERDILSSGDLEEGLQAAAAVGDDTLQRKAGSRVTPESWTHGSSEQRMSWFRAGFDTGRVAECDTFR